MSLIRYFRRSRWDDERARELDAHLAIEIDENLARGMTPDDARAAALRRLGSPVRIRENIYDMNTLPALETARLDLRDALRQLRRRPLVTVLALLLLAIGVGASAAAFSVAYGLLLRPLPYPKADRVAALWSENAEGRTQVSLPDFYDIRRSAPFDGAAVLAGGRVTLTGGADADRVTIVQSEPALFTLLGARTSLGRLPTESDDGHSAAVISQRLWRKVFSGDPKIIGRPIGVNGSSYTVIGVLDPALEFEIPVPSGAGGRAFTIKDVDIWTPLDLVAGVPLNRAVLMCEAIVRLKDGETFASTQAALDVIAANLANTYPDTNRGRRFVLSPLQDAVVAATSPAVFMGFAGGVLLLVIACTNVIGLFLGEMPLRRRDFALRAALGASRARLIRQVVVEGALLAVAGCGAGLLVARAIVAWLKAAADLPRVDAIRFDAPVAIWLVGIAAASGMLARVAPLLWMRGSREDLRASLPVYTASAPALRRTLVALQLALTVVLSATAILLAVSLRTISSVDPGFAPSHTLAARVSAYAARYPDKAATARFVNDIVRRIAQLPGVEAAAAGQAVPLAGAGGGTSVGVEGRPVPLSERPTATWSSVTPGYFRALGVPLLGGRDFLHADLDSRTHQTIINRALARHLFGDENPIGRRLQFGPDGSPADWHEIVGIVGDVRQESLSGSAGPAAYDLFGQHWGRSVYVIARGGTDPYALTPAIRAIVHDIDPQAPVFDVRSLDDIVNGTIAPRRTATAFATSIAAVSLLLAAIGLYGLLASSVVSRTRELGIRRALGSTTTAIVNLVLAEAAILAAAGTAVGVAATLAVARVIQSQLFGIRATDFRVLAVVVITLATTGGIAAYLPARRAVRVDPVVALRDE